MNKREHYIKEILQNELMREIVSIRIDSLCKMFLLKSEGYLPGIHEEGASGFYDNRGAIFIPGNFIFEDSDRNKISKNSIKSLDSASFRKLIVDSMMYDNATLIFNDSVVKGVNLPNGFFIEVASKILSIKNAIKNNTTKNTTKMPDKITSEIITKSYSPSCVQSPFGSRTKISSCIGACISEPELYYLECIDKLGIRNSYATEFWKGILESKNQIIGTDKKILAKPHVVVCHVTRFSENNLVGLTRILGIGGFGDFATLTIEPESEKLENDIQMSGNILDPSYAIQVNEYESAYLVLRIYTDPDIYNFEEYAVSKDAFVVSPSIDLDLNVSEILEKANERYRVKRYVEKE